MSYRDSTPSGHCLNVFPKGCVSVPASSAAFSPGVGIGPGNCCAPTGYDALHGLILSLAKGSEVIFPLPEEMEGNYDLYLTVSRIMAQYTSQPFCFQIDDGAIFSVPVDCQVSADSIARYCGDGDAYNVGSIYDKGLFPVRAGVCLHAGSTVRVIASFGAQAECLPGPCFPGIGDLLLVPEGTQISVGYGDGVPSAQPQGEDPLCGKTILWLGSSVTYGAAAAGHYSMVNAIEDRHPGSICEKYAISGTTLVNDADDSYVSRLMLIPKDRKTDLMVVQLSTNDASQGKPMGRISEGFDRRLFDDRTIAGAIETIIAYTHETFHCPVIFYTGTYCEKEHYAEMVDLLLRIRIKWNIGVIDLFHHPEMTAVYGTAQYERYMADPIHPNRAGYIEWWTPVMDAFLSAFMTDQAKRA